MDDIELVPQDPRPEHPYSIVYVTAPDETSADVIAGDILPRKLCACVSLTPGLRSRYWWQGEIQAAGEVLLTIKTKTDLIPELIVAIKAKHPYKVPEIVALPIVHGNEEYLDWIGASCAQKSDFE